MEQNFDQFAKDYRSTHTKSIKAVSGADSFYFAQHKVKELARFEENESLRFLDVGCGDGAVESYISLTFPSFAITGLDISQESIGVATKKKIPNCTFLLFDGVSIPFKENSFDIVFLASVLHHMSIQNQKNIIQEIHRVLKPGGRVYIFEHNPLNPITRYLVKMCEFDHGVILLYPGNCRKLLLEAGFSSINRNFTLFFPRKRIFKWFLKMENRLRNFPFGGQYYFFAKKIN